MTKVAISNKRNRLSVTELSTPTKIVRRAVALWKASNYDDSQLLKDLTGNGLHAQLGSAAGVDASDPKFLPYKPFGVNHDGSVALAGAGSYISAFDVNALGLVGTDFTIEAKLSMTDWTPGTTKKIVSKHGTAGGYFFEVGATGFLTISTKNGGDVGRTSTVAVPFADGAAGWVRATLDLDNGAGGSTTKFWTSSDGVAWVQLGANVVVANQAGPAAVSAPVNIGRYSLGGQEVVGRMYLVRLYTSDIGNAPSSSQASVADFDASKLDGPLYDDKLGNLWYGVGSAAWGDHFQNSAVVGNNVSSQAMANFDAGGDFRILTTYKNSVEHKIGQYAGGPLFRESGNGGTLSLYASFSPSGIVSSAGLTAAAGLVVNQPVWLRCWWRRDRGDGNYEVRFYWSIDGTNWTQLGATIVAATTGNAVVALQPVTIGSYVGGVTPYSTRAFRAIGYDINGALKFDVRFDRPGKWGNSAPTVTEQATEANGTSLQGKATTTGGKVWAVSVGGVQVTNGKLAATAGASRATFDAGLTDLDFSTEVVLGNATGTAVLLRYLNADNHISIHSYGGGPVTIAQRVGGVTTTLATGSSAAAGVHKYRVVAVGQELWFYRNGLLVATCQHLPASLKNNTQVGVAWDSALNAAVTFDDIEVRPAGHIDPQGNVWTISRADRIERLKIVTNSHVEHPGVTANWIETPTTTELDTPVDLDVRWYGAMSDYTPAATMTLVARYASSAGSWIFRVATNGHLSLFIVNSADSVGIDSNTSVPAGVADGTATWFRATYRQSDRRVQFFKSTDGITWTQIGTDQIHGATAIKTSAHQISIGLRNGSSEPLAGKTYEVQVWRGIPGVSASARLVANPKFTALTNYAPYKEPSYLALPGVSGSYASTPMHTSFDIVGDVDMRAHVSMDDWTPGTWNAFVGRYSSSTVASYWFQMSSAHRLVLSWKDDANGGHDIQSAVPLNAMNGGSLWIRATLDVDNGLSGHTVSFYTSTDGVTWTLLDSQTFAGVTQIKLSTSPPRVGAVGDSGNINMFAGKIHRAIIKNGIDGTSVFDASFENLLDGQASFVEITGKTVTINGTARIERRTWSFIRAALSSRAELRTGRYAYLPGIGSNYLRVATTPDFNVGQSLSLTLDFSPEDRGAGYQAFGRGSPTSSTLPGWMFYLTPGTAGAGSITFYISDGRGNVNNITVTVPNFKAGSGRARWRFSYTLATGVVTVERSFDGTAWTTEATGTIVSPTVQDPIAGQTHLAIGVVPYSDSTNPMLGNVYGVIHVVDGATVLDTSLADLVLMPTEPHNIFADLYGNVWTVTRNAALGLKTAVVTEPLFLFGSDDYLHVADTDLLDIGAGDSLTAVIAFRFHSGTSVGYQIFIAKKATIGTSSAGWAIGGAPASGIPIAYIGDGALEVSRSISPLTFPYGTKTSLGIRRNHVADTLEILLAGALAGSVADTTNGNLTNANPMRIGTGANNDRRADMEFMGAAVFKEALTDAQIAEVLTELNFAEVDSHIYV